MRLNLTNLAIPRQIGGTDRVLPVSVLTIIHSKDTSYMQAIFPILTINAKIMQP